MIPFVLLVPILPFLTSTDVLSGRGNQSMLHSTNKLPFMIIFVGPGKTGTTTLQSLLSNMDMKWVNFTFFGRCTNGKPHWSPTVQSMLPVSKNNNNNLCQGANFTNCFKRHAIPELNSTKTNVVVHDEFLCSGGSIDNPEVFLDAITSQFKLIVVLAYRRYFEVLPSLKQQFEKGGVQEWPVKRDPNLFIPGRLPGEGRARIVRSPSYFKQRLKGPEYQCHIWEKWIQHENIRILNYHHPDGLAKHFLCDVMPESMNTCNNRTMNNLNLFAHKNPSQNLDSQLIAVEAADRGLIDTSHFDRKTAVEVIKKCMHSIKVPVECLGNASSNALLETSIRFEKSIVAKYNDTNPHLTWLLSQESNHKEQFWASSQRFCSADIDAIMEDRRWQECFLLLGPGHIDGNNTQKTRIKQYPPR